MLSVPGSQPILMTYGTPPHPPDPKMAPTSKSSEPLRKSARNVTDEAPKCVPARSQLLARHGAVAASCVRPS